MKAWEVLKALDEGKKVERKNVDGTWHEYAKHEIGCWLVENVDKYEMRIKPEPEVFYRIKGQDGSFATAYCTATEEVAKETLFSLNKVGANYPYRIVKYVEELT